MDRSAALQSPAILLVTTLSLAALLNAAASAAPGELAERLRAEGIVAEVPPADEWYLAYADTNLDHHRLFHRLEGGGALEAADVLFLSNSRLQLAGSSEVFRSRLQAAGVPYYLLGFGQSEADLFPRALIEARDLRPRWVVINVDGFFRAWRSELAAKATSASRARARVWLAGEEASFAVKRHLHTLLPYLPAAAWSRSYRCYFRSRHDGAWRFVPAPTMRLPLALARGGAPTAEELEAGRAMISFLQGRGARVLLTCVPNPVTSREAAATLASALQVPFVCPEFDRELFTYDGSHLDKASADWFGEELTRQLLPIIARR